MRKTHLVLPGKVTSKNDGDCHVISFEQLCRITNLDPRRAWNQDQWQHREALRELPQAEFDALIRVSPSYDGDYPDFYCFNYDAHGLHENTQPQLGPDSPLLG